MQERGAIYAAPSLIETAVAGDWLSFVNNPDAGGNGTTKGQGSGYKFFFCFFFKFITGPVGLLLLKILPYFLNSFLWFLMLLRGFYFFFLTAFRTPVFYSGKKGEPKMTKVSFYHTPLVYFGYVLPLGFINHKWGQVYGHGSFGKFIVSLMFLSLAIIIMGV